MAGLQLIAIERYFMQNRDIPLKKNLEAVRILKLFNGTNDVEVAAFGGGNQVSKKSHFTREFEAFPRW
ncbi:hypothetical protein L596_010631 [Steinernema carpocapsae]|uniref:Uncharacterized protein n=1 Tax=Steinernema carpocapsae TaxID=34508 RepID=A0A4U5PIV3_STECR|nr:hypothetical protein L596_010631 [Steinernema carpocapsae]